MSIFGKTKKAGTPVAEEEKLSLLERVKTEELTSQEAIEILAKRMVNYTVTYWDGRIDIRQSVAKHKMRSEKTAKNLADYRNGVSRLTPEKLYTDIMMAKLDVKIKQADIEFTKLENKTLFPAAVCTLRTYWDIMENAGIGKGYKGIDHFLGICKRQEIIQSALHDSEGGERLPRLFEEDDKRFPDMIDVFVKMCAFLDQYFDETHSGGSFWGDGKCFDENGLVYDPVGENYVESNVYRDYDDFDVSGLPTLKEFARETNMDRKTEKSLQKMEKSFEKSIRKVTPIL